MMQSTKCRGFYLITIGEDYKEISEQIHGQEKNASMNNRIIEVSTFEMKRTRRKAHRYKTIGQENHKLKKK